MIELKENYWVNPKHVISVELMRADDPVYSVIVVRVNDPGYAGTRTITINGNNILEIIAKINEQDID